MSICSHVLYQTLLEDLANGCTGFAPGEPWPGITPRQFACQALSATFYKKFVEHEAADANMRAFEKFSSVNSDCRDWELTCNTSVDETLIGELKNSLYRFFYPSQIDPLIRNHHQILDVGRTGPGSSRMARGNDFYTKLFDSPLSTTSSMLYSLYEDYLSHHPNWYAAEETRKRTYGMARVVEGNQFHFVPKSDDITRLIAIEPNLNMFFQLGLGTIIEQRLESFFGISLATQPDKNRELARLGSIDESFVTIDLSSASDSLGLRMLEEVLPREVFSWLKLFRSPTALYEGKLVELNMISTMGNGYTFPLETVLFSAVVSAAARVCGVKLTRPFGNRLGSFAVFGDDIIVEASIASAVLRLLDLLGFKVNQQKTFVEGPFRESCGFDWFSGQNVRGIYLKSLSTQQDRYVAINNLNLWSAKVGIPLPRTIRLLRSTVKYRMVPPWENLDAGVRVPSCFLPRNQRKSRSGLLQYEATVPRPSGLEVGDGVIRSPKGAKKRLYNPSGLLISILGGYVKSGKIMLRHEHVSYRTKWATAPVWDWLPLGCDIHVGVIPGFFDYRSYKNGDLKARRDTLSQNAWGRWKSAIYWNLFQ